MGLQMRLMVYTLDKRAEEHPNWFPEVCEEIAGGGEVKEILARYDVSWNAWRKWLLADDGRDSAYQEALNRRADLRRELAAANVMEIATTRHAKSKITPADTLRAADMVLGGNKSQGLTVNAGRGAGNVKIEIEFVKASG